MYRFIWNNNWTHVIETVDMWDWMTSFKIDLSNNPTANSSEHIRRKADRMDLRSNDLKWLPIYAQTTILDARNNRISRIVFEEEEPNSKWSSFQLTELNLSNNSLTSIPSQLTNLAALETIDLSHNRLESLPKNVLSKLSDLKKISLNDNQLRKVNFGAVFNVNALEYLDVSNNNLESFRLNSIFPNLTELQINYNNLTVLDANIKRKAPKLVKVGLSGNNWTCDHLVDALQLIPFDQIDVDTSSSISNGGSIDEGHVIGITCLDYEAVENEQPSVSSCKADVEESIDAKVAVLLQKFDEINKRLEILSNLVNKNNNVV